MHILTERFIQFAMLASVLTGVLCSFIGIYVILKRIVFLGIAISEISALGVAAGLMIGFDPTASAIALAVVAAVAFWLSGERRSVSRESIIAFAYIAAAALTVVLIAKNPAAESKGLDLITGNLLYVQAADLVVMGTVAAAVLGIHVAFSRSFLFVSFDRETAAAIGLRAGLYDLLIYLTLGISVAVSMKVAGILFVFGSLVVPPLTGMLFGRRMITIVSAAIFVAVLSCVLGVLLSLTLDWPTAPTIILVMCALFLLLAAVRKAMK
jgi:ABC-type Mn2+/Zn2+ transport system permease subunit